MYGIPNMKLDKEKVVLRRLKQMEREGVVGPANHAGKRDVLAGPPPMV